MNGADAVAGFVHMDGKGRVSLSKSVRSALGLGAGSALAWVKLGDAVMLIPQDAHLEQAFDSAAEAFANARIGVDEMLHDLPAARAEVVAEHYGGEFLQTLERMREDQQTGATDR